MGWFGLNMTVGCLNTGFIYQHYYLVIKSDNSRCRCRLVMSHILRTGLITSGTTSTITTTPTVITGTKPETTLIFFSNIVLKTGFPHVSWCNKFPFLSVVCYWRLFEGQWTNKKFQNWLIRLEFGSDSSKLQRRCHFSITFQDSDPYHPILYEIFLGRRPSQSPSRTDTLQSTPPVPLVPVVGRRVWTYRGVPRFLFEIWGVPDHTDREMGKLGEKGQE